MSTGGYIGLFFLGIYIILLFFIVFYKEKKPKENPVVRLPACQEDDTP